MDKTPQPLTEQALSRHSDESDGTSSQFEAEGSAGEKLEQSSKSSNFGPDENIGDDSSSATGDLAKAETTAVIKSKACVYLILLFGALATAITAWFLAHNEEKNKFEADFQVYADQLIEISDNNAEAIFLQLRTLSTAITSRSFDQTRPFPYFAAPHYALRSKEVGSLAGSKLLMYTLMIPLEDVALWDQWVNQNKDQIMTDTFGASAASLADPVANVYPVPKETYQNIDLTLLNQTFHAPVLQYGPEALSSGLMKMDLNTHPIMQRAIRDSLNVEHTLVSEVFNMDFLLGYTNGTKLRSVDRPRSIIAEPIFNSFQPPNFVVGFVMAMEPWDELFGGNLPLQANGFVINLHTTCGKDWSYDVENGAIVYIGTGDMHDSRYDHINVRTEFAPSARYDGPDDGRRHCDYSFIVYPSRAFENQYYTNESYLFAMMLLVVFMVTVAVFVTYDFLVTQEQRKAQDTAKRSTEIVNSLFPKQVGDRLIAEAENKASSNNKVSRLKKMDAFMTGNQDQEAEYSFAKGGFMSDPIAEFYTDTTIMFADIVGFTAWSSMREPKHVFKLLESIYREYDQKANRRGVFKVETIGDCYVAVCGLPQPRKDHYAAMSRFARECVYGFGIITRQLAETLGPDTSDLAIRIGLHSGPVTAGVLRGDRARFQLFGDTMNTASRMESNGKANKIHISQETADLLEANGKGHWFQKREDLIIAKGKGQLQTYWLTINDGKTKSASSGEQSNGPNAVISDTAHIDLMNYPRPETVQREMESRDERLVKWNADILSKPLGSIMGLRKSMAVAPEPEGVILLMERETCARHGGALPELKEAINFPDPLEAPDIDVPEKVKEQLYDYIKALASMHRENPYHNFEHASHVMMALMKLFSCVGKTTTENGDNQDASFSLLVDPTAQFAAALSMLMSGVYNQGVPNTQLTKERANVAIAYGNTCVAEQNALDLSWGLLMSPDYVSLRRAIYSTGLEFKRFRQLVVNSVLTNSKELLARRKILWQSVFGELDPKDPQGDLRDHKATILLESLVHAADAAHTMQHWQIFVKWNTRLLEEAVLAHKAGRADYDPVEFWHDTEIGSFDNIVLPLAKNLKESGVLGASGDEYLEFAVHNRREWITRGKEFVEEMKQALNVETPKKRTIR